MELACNSGNLLDMRSRPSFESERVSQIWFGETFLVTSRRKGFARVEQADGYTGWVDERFIRPSTASLGSKPSHIIVARSTVVYDASKAREIDPYILYCGTPLSGFRQHSGDGLATIHLPYGRTVRLRKAAVQPIKSSMTGDVRRRRLVSLARKFLGVPYLWGGISPAGCDCSGFVRTVFTVFGEQLPRDTKDQIRAGHTIAPDSIRSGDLLFFERHVALALSRWQFIHSSRGGGGVRINSLVPDDDGYRDDLDRTFDQARRVL